jgi:hypothetical protein
VTLQIADGPRPRLTLWDVRDVEAHVRAIADATLREWKARLDQERKDELVAFLVGECWRISGLAANGAPRHEHVAELRITFASPHWSSLDGIVKGFDLPVGPFERLLDAVNAAGELAATHAAAGDHVEISFAKRRPRGAYDPERGLSFSTFSRRILSLRIVDWYRLTFGDSRYGDHQIPVSLEAMVADRARRDQESAYETYLDRFGPGAIDHFVDELHLDAYDHELTGEAIVRAIAC